jgi:AraC-like DNA-binding protein
MRGAKATQARAYGKAHFANPAASLDRRARQPGCSRGYLQKALAAEGTELSGMLRRYRAEMACNLPRSEATACRSFIGIAFSCGFIDL